MKETIFISWERHQRTRTLCKKLDIPLFEVVVKAGRAKRYLSSMVQTFNVIKSNKPKVLWVQNPSIILTTFCTIIRPFFRYKLIVDAHNEAITPYIHDNAFMRLCARLLIRAADNTVVTNSALADKVSKLSGRPLVIPDFLPNREPRRTSLDIGSPPYTVTFICTYAPDEPYLEVFKAVGELPELVNLYVTGKIPEYIKQMDLPENIKLLGFLSEDDYWEQLYRSHIIIDLTTMPDCLVCGAYEALAIEKPMILSRNSASVQYFRSAITCNNSLEQIKDSILLCVKGYSDTQSLTIEERSRTLERELELVRRLSEI